MFPWRAFLLWFVAEMFNQIALLQEPLPVLKNWVLFLLHVQNGWKNYRPKCELTRHIRGKHDKRKENSDTTSEPLAFIHFWGKFLILSCLLCGNLYHVPLNPSGSWDQLWAVKHMYITFFIRNWKNYVRIVVKNFVNL